MGKTYRKISLRIDEETYQMIKNLREKTGLSEREILAYSSQPCDCGPQEVSAYNSKDKSVKIPRGILFNSLLTKYSTYDQTFRINKKDSK